MAVTPHLGSSSYPATSGLTWPKSSISEGLASAPHAKSLHRLQRNTGSLTELPAISAFGARRTARKSGARSISTGLTGEIVDEVAGCQTLDRHCRSQDKRKSGGYLLEGSQGDRRRP